MSYRHSQERIPESAVSASPRHKNRRVAALLAILPSGLFGAHKFYVGNWKAGLIQLAISVAAVAVIDVIRIDLPLSLVAIFAAVEGIIYVLKTDAEFDSTYVNGRKMFL